MTLTIFLVAGEASGDTLGSKLMRALNARHPGEVKFYGVGGHKMEAEGLNSLFPMAELSVMGFAEILPHVPHLLKRIDETARYARQCRPDVVVTIDAPEFSFRVAKKLQSLDAPLVHYVAPSVWAYREKRAAKIAAIYDHLLTLLPFEPPYFEKEGLAATFVGHPIVEEDFAEGNGTEFRRRHKIPAEAPLIAVLPGSRQSEFKRLWPVYVPTLRRVAKALPNAHLLIPTVPHLERPIREAARKLSLPVTFLTAPAEKKNAYAACTIALAKSGTVTTELALAGVPMVVTYKLNPLSALLLRKVLKVPYVTLMNLLLNQPLVPELLQEHATPEKLSSNLLELLDSPAMQEHQRQGFRQALQMLGHGTSPSPSERAADLVLALARRG